MVDDAGAPPQPPTSDATGQDQSLDTNTEVTSTDPKVVSINRAKNKKSDDEATAESSPPAEDEANSDKKKTEKTIDWGKYNRLINNFALIYGTDTVWDGEERIIMKLANMAHAHGSDLVKMWKNDPRRKTYRQTEVVFDPVGAHDPEKVINLYDGIAMEPIDGDVTPFMELCHFLTSRTSENADDADQILHWMLCWLAYPLQNPGAKMRTSIIMHGDEGAGKNFLFDTVAMIYGKYAALVGQDELEDKFNDWRSCKLFVVGDEVSSRQELVHNKNRLKALITSPTVQINPKNLPRREESNHMNVVFLSNEITPLALDNSDRRYLVVYTPRAKDFSFYRRLGQWRKDGGAQALYAYLLAYPLDGFDPYAPAPVTTAKRDLIDMNRKSPELFWFAWHTGETELPYWPCSTSQAYRAYLKWCQRTGDRFPLKQNMFTRMVLRISESEGAPIHEKVMAPKDELGVKKAERMLLTLTPPDKDQGVWAGECRDAFEKELKRFLGVEFPRSPNQGNDGDEA